jgi:transketolase
MGNIPCRTAIKEILVEKGKKNKNLFVVTSDARGSVLLEKLADELPEQFVEVGIAEQNAVGISAGLALAGKNVFVCEPSPAGTSLFHLTGSCPHGSPGT